MLNFKKYIFFVSLFYCFVKVQSNSTLGYKSNDELKLFMENFCDSSNMNNISTRLYTIGHSENDFPLQVIEITAVDDPEKIGIPNVKLIANIHGDEPVGREVLTRFLEYLSQNYVKDETVTWLLKNTKIHILPTMNPDGFDIFQKSKETNTLKGRENKNNVDLNRSFPDYFHPKFYDRMKKAKESVAVIEWMKKYPFILSAALHGGSLVANYPFDGVKSLESGQKTKPSPTVDNDVFVHLAKTYSLNHKTMHNTSNQLFKDGIVNGARWYIVNGGMGDYNYAFEGCMEITFEITPEKEPEAKDLDNIWEDNKKALLEYCKKAHMGVTGQILDSKSKNPIQGAELKITGRDMTFKSKDRGQFWRILLPGNYTIMVSAKGYYDTEVDFKVNETTSGFPKLTFLPIYMTNSSFSTTPKSTTSTSTTTSPPTTTTTTMKPEVFLVEPRLGYSTNSGSCCINLYKLLIGLCMITLIW